MTISEAKQIDLTAYLDRMGLPGEKKGHRVWYCSPLHNERTASFAVDLLDNRFRDYAIDKKGDIIDLVKILHNTDTSGALQILAGGETSYPSFLPANIGPAERAPRITINNVRPLHNEALLQYIDKRQVSRLIACRYLNEAYYSVSGFNKRFFALCFRNDKGGYELRNPYFKGSTSPKFITTIAVENSTELDLFEGFMDALSYLEYIQEMVFPKNTIILNSLSHLQLIIPYLDNYSKVNLYLDNDLAGSEAVKKIKSVHSCTIDNAKLLYPMQKDFNEYLMCL